MAVAHSQMVSAWQALPSQQYLRECFDYQPESGVLRWRERPRAHFTDEHSFKSFSKYIGLQAGANYTGRRQMKIDQKMYMASRVIWRWMTGDDPGPALVDHKNTDFRDDRWDNLRLATDQSNQWNRSVSRRNHCGVKGVSKNAWPGYERWTARMRVDGKTVNLGTFPTIAEAKEAYDNAAQRFHGEFFRP